MQLAAQGAEADLPAEPLTISLQWNLGVDFDLAAMYETRTQQHGLVYFGNLGHREQSPYIRLSRDQGVGDKQGHYQEVLNITRFEDVRFIWIFCWDYHKTLSGEAARFDQTPLMLEFATPNFHATMPVPTEPHGNVCCVATIDCLKPQQPRLINTSAVTTVAGLTRLSQLMSVLQTAESIVHAA